MTTETESPGVDGTLVAETPPEKASLWEDFIEIFFAPSAVFARRRDGRFWLALIVYTLLIGAFFAGASALGKAGIMLSGEGLQPSSKGARVRFSGDRRTVIDGPFTETKELIAGFWLWQVKSKEEAIEWVKRCPNPMPGTEAEIEIRQVFEIEDFGAEFTPELREQEERLRARLPQR